ncbi:AAA family ATPase [Phenylobacterium sp.]|uniref:AAA family ATPase n=1 Tax=Phenylobacterium sp. TaxID=1871053 RepID=UPI003BAC92A3
MSHLYLQSVAIKDFRTFGEFSVDIPAGPGLTLLTGTNGLGKSSFFDAMEWGLTGRVARFQRYLTSTAETEYLLRRGADGPHSVTLEFNDGAPITREGDVGPAAERIIDLLRRPDWGAQIQDIGTYLAFTHFLGQAEPQRFTSREKGEQWASLKGPSGIERLEEVRRGLRGRSTQLAFTRRFNQAQAAVNDAERALAQWQTWQARLSRLKDASSAAGALSTAELADRLAALAVDLEEAGWPVPTAASNESLSGALTRLKAVIDKARVATTTRQRALQALADLPERFAARSAAVGAAEEALVAAESQRAADRAAEGEAQAAFDQASENLAGAVAEMTRAQAELDALDSARQDLEAIDALAARHTSATADQAALVAALAAKRVEVAGLEALIPPLRALIETARQARTGADAAGQRLVQAREWESLQRRSALSAAEADRLEQLAGASRTSLTTLVPVRTTLTEEHRASAIALAAARERATSMAVAVAQVASHLHDSDENCPVCQSHFPPGILSDLARRAAAAQSADLAAAEVDYARLSTELAANAASIGSANAAIAEAESARLAAEADGDAARHALEALQILFLVADDNLMAAATAADAAASAASAAANASARTAEGDLASALNAHGEANAEVGSLITRLEDASASLAVIVAERRKAEERVASGPYAGLTLVALIPRIQTQTSLVASAIELRDQRQASVDGARAHLEAARQAVTGSAQSSAVAAASLQSERDSVAALEIRWRDAGLAQPISANTLETAADSAANGLSDLERFEDRRSEIVQGSAQADREIDLQSLIVDMEAAGGAGSTDAPKAREDFLTTQVAQARQVFRQTRDARIAVRKVSEKLRDEADKFSTQFLAPLNDLIGGFNEALLSAPGDSVRFQADHRVDTTHFDMGMQYRDPLEEALYNNNLPPQVFLSEGQLAANGFSILCAASTAYPWSRWRSLLLDDPLQHNDIIHAAAFVDLMRNLVEIEGYQLIMSSHDRAEGDFIARKFDAAGLPCKIIALTAPSKSGVRYEQPSPNLAAERLLGEVRAKSA